MAEVSAGRGATTADVLVIGLGAVGSAITWQLAQRGVNVIGIDRFTPPHALGSSHGATRITRLAVGEGETYVPLVTRAHAIWQALEAATGVSLYLRTGGLILGPADGRASHHGKPAFVQRCIATAQRFGIAHEVLSAAETMRRFPQFVLRGDEQAYWERDSGVLRPEACIQAQLDAARQAGAQLRFDEQVLSCESTPSGVSVTTSRGRYSAAQAVMATGAWLPGMTGGTPARSLRVLRQVLYWFESTSPALYAPTRCPVFIWMHGPRDEDYLYGFPMADPHAGVKVATEQYHTTTDPDGVDRSVSAAEAAQMHQAHVAGRLLGVTPRLVHAAACMYTTSTDAGFVVDRHPTLDHTTVVSACSGHGFKHSAGLGEVIAQALASGGGIADPASGLAAFSSQRF